MSDLRTPEVEDLLRVFAALDDEDVIFSLLEDLFTIREIKETSQRLAVARQLDAGKSYSAIEEATGASATTIARVSKCLRYGGRVLPESCRKLDSARFPPRIASRVRQPGELGPRGCEQRCGVPEGVNPLFSEAGARNLSLLAVVPASEFCVWAQTGTHDNYASRKEPQAAEGFSVTWGFSSCSARAAAVSPSRIVMGARLRPRHGIAASDCHGCRFASMTWNLAARGMARVTRRRAPRPRPALRAVSRRFRRSTRSPAAPRDRRTRRSSRSHGPRCRLCAPCRA